MLGDPAPRTTNIQEFWGKASSTAQAGPSCHPITHHSLDVAAVGAEMISRDQNRLKRMAAAVGLDIEALRGALPFLLGLHDIGKYSRVFQAKAPDHWPASALGPYRETVPGNNHVDTGLQMLVAFSEDG